MESITSPRIRAVLRRRQALRGSKADSMAPAWAKFARSTEIALCEEDRCADAVPLKPWIFPYSLQNGRCADRPGSRITGRAAASRPRKHKQVVRGQVVREGDVKHLAGCSADLSARPREQPEMKALARAVELRVIRVTVSEQAIVRAHHGRRPSSTPKPGRYCSFKLSFTLAWALRAFVWTTGQVSNTRVRCG